MLFYVVDNNSIQTKTFTYADGVSSLGRINKESFHANVLVDPRAKDNTKYFDYSRVLFKADYFNEYSSCVDLDEAEKLEKLLEIVNLSQSDRLLLKPKKVVIKGLVNYAVTGDPLKDIRGLTIPGQYLECEITYGLFSQSKLSVVPEIITA